MQGHYQEGYDVLDSSNEKRTQQFHRAAVCGFLRHAQVCEVRTSSSCTTVLRFSSFAMGISCNLQMMAKATMVLSLAVFHVPPNDQ